MHRAGYEAVVFDMDGTLVEFTGRELRREAAVAAFRSVGIDPDESELRAVVRETTANARAVCRDRGVDPADFYARFDPLLAEHQLEAIEDGGKPPHEDALDALDRLGVGASPGAADAPAVAVVSNNYQPVVDRVVERYFPDRFPVAYGTTPGLEGRRRRKPEPHHLREALSALGVGPERALIVGDSSDDVGAGAAAGVDAAHLDRDGRRPAFDPAPTHRIDGLDALPTLVRPGASDD